MFKKLKQKISEEQGTPRSTSQPSEGLGSSSVAERQNESISVHRGREKNESHTLAQKLQFRVPSVESLFRSPSKEVLFRSLSKDSLARSSSRDSLHQLDLDAPVATYDPPSDIESEAEDLVGNQETLSREQLIHQLQRMDRSLGNYRMKYSELVTTYRTLQREKEKIQVILSQSQDKALRRIGELREELQMDQQAKKHLQEEFDAALEEKDQLISVLQTQNTLLKLRLGNEQLSDDSVEVVAPSSDRESHSPTKEIHAGNTLIEGAGDAVRSLEVLQQRVKRQETLLHRCKETIKFHKECSALLTSEKEALQEQLEERLQELEKLKEKCHSEYLGIIQEKEQQGLLALEELELQKNAVQLQNDEKIQELHQEVESQRTVFSVETVQKISRAQSLCSSFHQKDMKQKPLLFHSSFFAG
ncbi:golgin subfamily A member 4-like [Protopterus annectens]|uniref:golgin subfamily A member 4-like n=1 Tax=Protopterus annectens TaxID=7888 RepID=UPI001CFBFFE0|nr:golgin subfamily A member 4-like [Protopterus annectens]